MGCGTSSSKVGASQKVARNMSHLVTENANAFDQFRALAAIKKDDAFLTAKALESVKPTQNLAYPGASYTCIHAAGYYNSYQAMTVLIQKLEDLNLNIQECMKIVDIDGFTPIIYCIKKDSFETLTVLIERNAVDWNFKDEKGHDFVEICHKHGSACLDLFSKYLRKDQPLQENAESQKKMEVMNQRILRAKTAVDLENQYLKETNSDNKALLGVPKDSQVHKLITKLAESDENFQDPDFLHNVTSITDDEGIENYQTYKDALWLRPTEIFQTEWNNIYLFDDIESTDIQQGTLGICYLLSSLSALAEYPSRLTPIFLNKKCNKYGVYALKIYIKGIPTEIVVDDYFPCSHKTSAPLFSQPKGPELWVLLAEKAWAKQFKNYTICEIGFMDEAFESLLGIPAARHVIAIQETEEVWNNLIEADLEKWITCAGTRPDIEDGLGLVPGHGYSVISVHTC